jgi:hypothetical protein
MPNHRRFILGSLTVSTAPVPGSGMPDHTLMSPQLQPCPPPHCSHYRASMQPRDGLDGAFDLCPYSLPDSRGALRRRRRIQKCVGGNSELI